MARLPFDDDARLHKLIDYLGHDLDPSILIGGWATFERVGGEISKDIDLIIGSDEVRAKVEERVSKLNTSYHLGGEKWSGEVDGVHVDIYLPYRSELGEKLRLRVEILAKYTESFRHKGWKLLTLEAHTVSKLAALLDRPEKEKGQKDAGEVHRLLLKGVDPEIACSIWAEATAGDPSLIPGHVETAFKLVAELSGANKAERRDLDRNRRAWADAATSVTTVVTRARPKLGE